MNTKKWLKRPKFAIQVDLCVPTNNINIKKEEKKRDINSILHKKVRMKGCDELGMQQQHTFH